MKNGYFYIKDAKTVGEKLVLSGDYILADTLEVKASGNKPSSAGQASGITVPGIFKVKWILPPRTSGMYSAVKSMAESAGYDTVEHDDFSYPPPRV